VDRSSERDLRQVSGRLRDRVGLITGAANGIGLAGAELFAAEGATLILLDTDADGGMAAARRLQAAGHRVAFRRGDCADPAAVEAAVAAAVGDYGKLDLLWSNAGTGVSKTVPETTLEEWERVVAVNLTGAFLLAKFGIPELVAAGGGTMVITGSANSVAADRRWAAYCATKGGLLMLCRAMALDHAADGVRVNLVCPGSVTTSMHDRWLRERAPHGYERAREDDRAAHPMDRFGTPEEVARAAVFLSCDESSFTTGSAVFVDGGVTAG
jgi:NAD(P)-dependent dehydrogenase (short-subunit alcohol dehydrogenase family)